MASFSSGIQTQGQDRIIPSSQRPDGTLRKERRVRQGFVPAEDVVKYKNVHVQRRLQAGIPGYHPPSPPPAATSTTSPPATTTTSAQKESIHTRADIFAILLQEMLIADLRQVCDDMALDHNALKRPAVVELLSNMIQKGSRDVAELAVKTAKITALRQTMLRLSLSAQGDRTDLVSQLQAKVESMPDQVLADINLNHQRIKNAQVALETLEDPKDEIVASLTEFDSQVQYEKRAKALKKKLRQMDQIQEKLLAGETLLPEQVQKLETRSLAEKELKEIEKALEKVKLEH